MPDRFHIHTAAVSGRFRRVGKFGSVDWREDCSRCTNCVKLRCVYDTYKKEGVYNRDPATALEPLNECKACLSCVQGCTKGLLAVSLSPEFLAMGDEYWRPDIIATTWNQSDTGKIPVSGAGYRGRFHGPGFDSIWTDMSEIVRPTRDGIHGREYISTSVDIGPKPMRLQFGADGSLQTPDAALLEVQMPVLLDLAPWQVSNAKLLPARAAAAKALLTLAVGEAADVATLSPDLLAHVAPVIRTPQDIAACQAVLPKVRMVQIADGPDFQDLVAQIQALAPAAILAARVDLKKGAADRVAEIARGPVKVFHVCADLHGREKEPVAPRHIKDALREVHGRLVSKGIRDEVTLIIAGGIALAEHMAKAIICGADLVAVDIPLLISLGCRVCRTHGDGAAEKCPADVENLDTQYAAGRFVNLMGAWHSQLIEVLGAMGIREVRRLRGEVGRAIFMEDIEKEAFGDLIRK